MGRRGNHRGQELPSRGAWRAMPVRASGTRSSAPPLSLRRLMWEEFAHTSGEATAMPSRPTEVLPAPAPPKKTRVDAAE